ncbi:hypothetical protein NEOC65_001830 [Neochlamydia sp. AcF65]|nr:hypothetical protein [Neochlamydia sp. AcF65]
MRLDLYSFLPLCSINQKIWGKFLLLFAYLFKFSSKKNLSCYSSLFPIYARDHYNI